MFHDLEYGNLIEVEGGARWDPAEVERQVAARMRRLMRAGWRRGDRVMLLFGNRAAFFAELLATWRLGGCAIPIDGRLTPFEAENLARFTDARFAVRDDGTSSDLVRALAGAGVTVFAADDVERCDGTPRVAGMHLDSDALILFTSGTTGDPKGVVHTHRSLRARWGALRAKLGLAAYRRTLCLLPTHFGHGLICNALFPWLCGQDLFVARPFSPELLMRLGAAIDAHGITFLSSVPSVWRLVLRTSKPPTGGTLERVHCGSAPLSAHLWNGIRAWTGTREVFNAYGITETGSWVAGTSLSGFTPADGLIGEGWGTVVKILRSGSTDEPLTAELECAPGEPGYVWLGTPGLMRGYFRRTDLTAAAVRDGWFLTGDIGTVDEAGRLHLLGREREEINKGGMKIQPADVDAVVERFAATRDVCTFAFEDPDYGQNVGIAVVLADERDETVRGLVEWIKVHLAEHKRPVRWYRLDQIPRTSRGKINRDSVRQMCSELDPLDLPGILRRAS